VTLTSRPLGEEVAVDGTVRGRTPLRLDLAPGRHELRFGSGDAARSTEIDVQPDARNLWTYQPAEGSIR
jgi:hypothetical protein